jgi:hypothetical protein
VVKKGEHHALVSVLDRCYRIIQLAKTSEIRARKNAAFFARECNVSPATIHRDIVYINSNPVYGSLQWDAHIQSYCYVEKGRTAVDRENVSRWRQKHIIIIHQNIDDSVWDRAVYALEHEKGVKFDYHDMRALVHKTDITLGTTNLRLEEGEWFLTGSTGEEQYNLRYVTRLQVL